jgi:hypothetical protein
LAGAGCSIPAHSFGGNQERILSRHKKTKKGCPA